MTNISNSPFDGTSVGDCHHVYMYVSLFYDRTQTPIQHSESIFAQSGLMEDSKILILKDGLICIIIQDACHFDH